ncbi:MAG: S8 family serine peptidase [Halioglobus sp.]|nr:S8 family serine peptidase [Halioglobus sp.]
MRITRTVKAVAGAVVRPAMQAVLWTVVAGAPAIVAAADMEMAAQQPVVSGMVAAPFEVQKPHYKEVNGKSVYIIQLSSPAVAAYRGGISGLRATNPQTAGVTRLNTNSADSRAYRKFLATEQRDFLAEARNVVRHKLQPRFSYRNVFNGVALELTEAEAKALAKIPGVKRVERERHEVLLTDNGPQFIGAPDIWNGNPGNMGEGAVIGILDTGINSDHPSFAAVGGDGYQTINPLGTGNYIPGSYCDTTDPSFCNDKLIGAWSFVNEPVTPNDSDNHGSHTASTAAGNVLPDATVVAPTTSMTRAISGVAPHANIIAYDVCIDTCPGSALLAAVEQIVIDASNLPNGIQALNYSISGGNTPYSDAVELGFLNANAAGIYPAVSAGNEGPGPATTGHNSPWVGATAASSHQRALNGTVLDLTSDGGSLANLNGATFSAGYGPAPIVYAGDFPTNNGSSNDTQPAQCLEPFPPGTWNGEIVMCDRGTAGRVEKGANVLAGGAGGYVLANLDANGESVVADGHVLPAVHIGDTAGDMLRDWLAANTNTMATLSGTEIDVSEANADIMAGFSSRGPNSSIEVIKPDISAPGVDIMAAFADGMAPAPEFGIISGTSMASPHHAGAAALVSQLTDWTPSEIKSAFMLTATKPANMLKEDRVTPADPFDVGAGRINLEQVLNVGLVMDETIANYEAANPSLGGDPKALNLASMANHACIGTCSWTRTVRNVAGTALSWQLSVADSNGVTFSVVPQELTLNPGEEGSLTVTADATLANAGFTFAELELVPGDSSFPSLHMPIALLGVNSSAPELLTKTVDLATASPGDVLNYEISATNGPIVGNIQILDLIPPGVAYVDGSASATVTNGTETSPVSVVGNTLEWGGELDVGDIEVADNGAITGYIGLSQFFAPITLPANADDGGLIFNVPAFDYNGATYTQILWSVNGTLEVGAASGLAASASNQQLPDPTAPNNLLAPLWTDLNLTNSGNAYVGVLTDGISDYLIFEWEDAPLFSDPGQTYTFQVWIVVGTDQIWFTYDNVSATNINMTVGAENIDGTSGDSYFYNGSGLPPVPGQDLEVVATVGGNVTINFQGHVNTCESDAIVNKADLSSSQGEEFATAVTQCSGQPPIPGDVNGDGVVDITDVNLVVAARNELADGPGDPRDMNGDGLINVTDARLVALQCTLPRCAPATP